MTTPSSSQENSHDIPSSSSSNPPIDHTISSSPPSDSSCSQTIIHQNCPTSLLAFFPSLKLFSDKNYLYNTFSLIKSHQHLYHSQWLSLIETIPNLFEISFELLQRFEINGLQLNGLGCWFFHQIISFSSSSSLLLSSILNSKKYSPEVIIELLLRILLEHPVSNDCISIFSQILKYKKDTVMVICQIG
jgi:hypothetical protein